MALIKCPECGESISDKARSCPRCGLPMSEDSIVRRMSKGAASAVETASRPFKNPDQSIDLAQLFNDLEKLPSDFNGGRTVNGIGSSVGGYTEIPGNPGLGIVREYLCIFFIPIFPLGLYLVKDWRGDGGIYLGKISSEKAAKYVSVIRQGGATAIGGIAKAILLLVFVFLMMALIASIRK